MRPFTIDVDPANTDTDGLADNNDSSGSSLTLDGALTSGGTFTSADGHGRRIQFTDTATVDQSGATFTITGTDADDNALTEAVTGPGSGATVTSTSYFKTVTSIAIASGAACGTVDAGTADEVVTKSYPMNFVGDAAISLICNVTGTANYTVQHTGNDILADGTSGAYWAPHDTLVSLTADADGNYDFPVTGIRAVFNSFTDTAELQIYVIQGV